MEYMIEVESLEEEKKSTRIYLKGWVHKQDYKIVIKTRGEKIIEECKYASRYDINKAFHEKIEENNYGFEIDDTIPDCIKQIEIYLVDENGERCIGKLDKRKIHKIVEKQKRFFTMFKKAILLFWREYHFLVPPTMLKKYWNDFLKKTEQIKDGVKTYQPMVPIEYQTWLQKIELPEVLEEIPVTFVMEKQNEKLETMIKEKVPHAKINVWSQKEAWLSKIKTNYVCFIDDNVLLSKSFSSIVARTLKEEKKIDLLYTDFDELNENKERVNPHLLPDWSKDTLLGANYIGNLFIIKKDDLKELNSENWNLYAMLLHLSDQVSNVSHISKILYSISKKEKEDASLTISTYLKKNRINATVEKITNDASIVTYQLKEKPLVSILIPTKDHIDLLKTCIDSILQKTTYPNYEIIVIDNNSEKEETFTYFKKDLKKKKNVIVERLECPFNYSYINNVGVNQYAKGDYIVLLNNDTEIITPNWLELMLGYASREEIGTVGVKLLFPDETIQHAGIIMGKGGLAGHAHYGKPRNYEGVGCELKIPYNVIASTAACLMFSKRKFTEVGGLEEQLQVAFNDVDFNLKMIDAGYRNIFLPNVEVYHYESKSRGLDTTPEKQKRFMQEWQFMEEKWKDKIKHDPYYNDNYSKNEDYCLEIKEDVK